MNIRLEYSQIKGRFNLAQAKDDIDTSKGFTTLCCMIDQDRARRFIERATATHPELSREDNHPYPTYASLKNELLVFIADDLKILEQQMNTAYQRRAYLFTKHT